MLQQSAPLVGVEVPHVSFRYPNVFKVEKPKMTVWARIVRADESNDWQEICQVRREMNKKDLRAQSAWINDILSRIAYETKEVGAAKAITDRKLRGEVLKNLQ